MSGHPQPSPSAGHHPHHGPIPAHQVNGHLPVQSPGKATGLAQKIVQLNETVWLQIGSLSEMMGDLDGALHAYEQALRHNQYSIPAMSNIASVLRTREQYPKATEYLQNIIKLDQHNGESWGSLGHCYLMMDNLQDAYSAYQQALYHLPDPKEPKLWYGIGILYDRYGSLDHAEDAFTQVMRMQPDFEKANEIYFRLGIIYKQQQKFQQSLDCFNYIVDDPPRPLTKEDIWFQIGHVHEQQKDFEAARGAYERVLQREPNHAKVLQQLGWLYHQHDNSYASQEKAIEYLEKSVSADNREAQSWYLLGRCYMSQTKYSKAYEAYQQAVYRDGRNPTFWCSIGVLYYQISQYRDALDAYSRAIRLNPYISEVWYDLGTLYESCHNQTNDALDAYSRAAELDPTNVHIKARLQLLQSGQTATHANAPQPHDPTINSYQAAGPHWDAPAPTGGPPPQGPAPPGRVPEWGRSEIPSQQHPGQAPGQFDHHREALRGHPAQSSPKDQGPDPLRFQQGRKPPHSPSPKFNPAAANPYAGGSNGPQTLPHPGQHPPPPQHERGPNGAGYHHPPPLTQPPGPSGLPNGASQNGPVPAYGRPFTPPPNEMRPIREERPISPGSTYPPQPYHVLPRSTLAPSNGGIASGAPPPTSALSAAEVSSRDRDDRPGSAMKRGREWEAEGPSKKLANEENRSRLEEPQPSRRVSPGRLSSPHEQRRRRSSSEIRREDQVRRAHDVYHPSDAAHHPPTLPSIQHMGQASAKMAPMGEASAAMQTGPLPGIQASIPSAGPPQSNSAPSQQQQQQQPPQVPKDERDRDRDRERDRERERKDEPPARKMDVDEDYDDDGDEEKMKKKSSVSPKGIGMGTGSSGAVNGASQGQSQGAKAEPAA